MRSEDGDKTAYHVSVTLAGQRISRSREGQGSRPVAQGFRCVGQGSRRAGQGFRCAGQGVSPAVSFSAALARALTALALLVAFAGTAALWAQPSSAFSKMADLSSPARLASDWTLDGSGSWAIRDGLLVLEKAGVPSGPIRRPGALAILQSPSLADATLEVDVRSLAAETVKQRDVLLVAGWQSPTRFYYVHLSAIRDNVHNGIFLVDDADRRRIDTLSDNPPLTDQAWHRARLVHRANGRLEVYVDGGADPIMLATDATLPGGRMGVGSFDDAAEFRTIQVTGTVR